MCRASKLRSSFNSSPISARGFRSLPDEKKTKPASIFRPCAERVVSQFERIIKLSPQLPDDLQTIVINIEDAGRLADYVATNLPNLSIVSKQFVLEQMSVRKRLEYLNTELAKELEVLELRSKIQNQVQEEVGKSQREYFLREQLRAIQRELGEGDDTQREIEELRKKVEASGMPEEAKKEAERELGRLAPNVAGGCGIHRYANLSGLAGDAALECADDGKDRHRQSPGSSRPGSLRSGKDQRAHSGISRGARTEASGQGADSLFCRTAGRGKDVAGPIDCEAMGRKFVRVSLGGMRDEAEIRGHRRTYIGALPGQMIQNIRRAGSRDPVFMLDEIDKLGADFRGDPASALLEVLDPGTELHIPRSLSRRGVRSFARLLHHDGKCARHRFRPPCAIAWK